MGNGIGMKLQQNRVPHPHLGGVFHCLPAVSSFSSVPTVARRVGGCRESRRLVLGIGVSFLSQFINMAHPSSNLAAKSFIAFARQKGAVEKVNILLFHFLFYLFIYRVLGFLGSV